MTRNEQRAERGRKAIALHPDQQDFETATTDIIADILHAAEAGGVLPSEMDALINRALNTYEGDAEDDEQDDRGLIWASTGNLNSRDHIAAIEPFQNKALCGAAVAGMTETRPGTPNVCPKCARAARALGVDPARLGLKNDLYAEMHASPFSEVGPRGEDHS